MSERYAVIMAGGRGERFWPQSRLECPKHLLPIVGDKPMLAQTIERLAGLVPPERILILTNRRQRAAVEAACPQIPPAHILCEPVGRDTAPAVGLAALAVKRRDPSATFAMLPADHVIQDAEAFRSVLEAAFEAAEAEPILATIGIKPTEPATGYGYIRKGEPWRDFGTHTAYRVRQFVEKPDRSTAEDYLASGDYDWNAGMFVWSVSAIEDALARHTPILYNGLRALEADLEAGTALDEALETHFPTLEKISIDYAIMEKADNVVTLGSTFDWDDVGAWPALTRHYPEDERGNVAKGLAALHDAYNNLVISDTGHLTALLGVDDLIVVHTANATLVCPKERAQDIKELVKAIGERPELEHLL